MVVPRAVVPAMTLESPLGFEGRQGISSSQKAGFQPWIFFLTPEAQTQGEHRRKYSEVSAVCADEIAPSGDKDY